VYPGFFSKEGNAQLFLKPAMPREKKKPRGGRREKKKEKRGRLILSPFEGGEKKKPPPTNPKKKGTKCIAKGKKKKVEGILPLITLPRR